MSAAYLTSLIYLTLGVILILLGVVIFKENFKQRINRITGAMMFFAGLGSIFGAFGLYLSSTGGQAELAPFRRLFFAWEFFFPQMLLFSLVFPREHPLIKKHARLIWMIFIPHGVHFLMVLGFSSPDHMHAWIDLTSWSDRLGWIAQPVIILVGFFLSLLELIYTVHIKFFALVNFIYIVTAIALMMVGYRSIQNPRLKQQVGLVIWGIRASVGLYAVAFILPNFILLRTTQTASHALTSVALLIGAGSIAWAIIRYQFLDIRLIIRRGLVFSMAFALLVGGYLAIYQQGKRVFAATVLKQVPLVEILFIIVALILFQPLLSVIERFIESIFMRDRLDFRNVLQNLSNEILTTLDIEALRETLSITLMEALSVSRVDLLLSGPDGSFSLRNKGDTERFQPQTPWIARLREVAAPVGFDSLQLQVEADASLESLRILNPFLVIPLIHRQEMNGILLLGGRETRTKFNAEDMTLLSVLSNQVAIAIENSRLYSESLKKKRIDEELGFASEIQQNLLPLKAPVHERFELAGYNLPSKEVGGDYYDFISLDAGKLGIAVGDISGKGVPAAILMSNLQAAFRISARRCPTTWEAVQQVNVHISRTTTAERFATFFYGMLDAEQLRFEYTNAGHNAPILLRQDGQVDFLKTGGLVMGIMENAQYETGRVQMRSGDVLTLYTDGITEALNPVDEEYGEERLLDVIQKSQGTGAQGVMNNILESVIDYTHGHLQTDDLTLVVLNVR